MIANRIRGLILSGELGDGDRLPPTEALIQQFGVSVGTMREALRILESEGLVTVQRGKVGGAVVHHPKAHTAAYAIALVLKSKGTRLGDMLSTQSLLEPICARLCAQRTDRKRVIVPELRSFTQAARENIGLDDASFSEPMQSFHHTLVQGCGSDTLALFVGIVESVFIATSQDSGERTAAQRRQTDATKMASLKSHERICDLIEAGDDVGAFQEVAVHVEHNIKIRSSRLREVIDPSLIRLDW